MHFQLSSEQTMIVDTVRTFVEKELYPYEDEVERTDAIAPELAKSIQAKAIEVGLYAANMPSELGGGGLRGERVRARGVRRRLRQLRPIGGQRMRDRRLGVQHPLRCLWCRVPQ